MRHPSEHVSHIEDETGKLPLPHERIDEEDVPREWHKHIIHAVRVLEVNHALSSVLTVGSAYVAVVIA